MIVSISINETQELFERYNNGNMTLDIVNNVVTVLMLIVSTFSLFVAWKVYHQSELMHKDNMNLTKKIHADSLTPYIVIKTSSNFFCFETKKFVEMKIRKIDISDKIYLNDIAQVDINEIKGRVCIEFALFNMSDLPAELKITYKCLNCEWILEEHLTGNEEKIVKSENSNLIFDKSSIEDVINEREYIMFNLQYIGPGMSATDIVSGKMKLYYNSEAITNKVITESLKRERNYN